MKGGGLCDCVVYDVVSKLPNPGSDSPLMVVSCEQAGVDLL